VPEAASSVGILFNNIRVNSINFSSGIFAGYNIQYQWYSDIVSCSGFGKVRGVDNVLESPCDMVTDPGSSSELLKYFEELVRTRIGKRGI